MKDHVMTTQESSARTIGLLLLIIFISGILIYQVLRGPYVFADDYLNITAAHSDKVIGSILLAYLSGILSVVVSVLILPTYKKVNETLPYLYLVLCIVGFVTISLENQAALHLLSISQEYQAAAISDQSVLEQMGVVAYKNHEWVHYIYLLISCIPVGVLYFGLLKGRLVPKGIALFGILASVLMFAEMLLSILGRSISPNLMLPMGLVQLVLPIWLIAKGFKTSQLDT